MTISTYGLVAASALVTNAFIIPSTMSLSSEGSDMLSSSLWGQSPAYRGDLIMLTCTGCSWTEPDQQYNSHSFESSSIGFNFSLSHDSKDILLNGESLYGPTSNQFDIVVPQIPSDASPEELEDESHSVPVRYRELDFTLAASAAIDAADESTVELIDLKLKVHSLDDEQVHLNRVGLRVLKDKSGVLRIMDIGIIPDEEMGGELFGNPTKESTSSVHSKQNICASHVGPSALFCQLRAFMSERLARLHNHSRKPRPCSSRKHGYHSGHRSAEHPSAKGTTPKSWKNRVDDTNVMTKNFLHRLSHSQSVPNAHKGPHGHHGPHTHRFCLRKVLRAFKHALVGFILPALAGVLIGYACGLLLLAVLKGFNRLLCGTWYTSSIEESREEEDAYDEGERFQLLNSLEDQAAFKHSKHEDPPAYVEKSS